MSDPVLSQTKRHLYADVTEKIVAAIADGATGYRMPWHARIAPIAMPRNAATGAAYRGINIIILWAEALGKGYVSGSWASYRQWRKLGAQVRRNERGTTIVFFRRLDETAGGEEEETRPRYVLRASRVFNAHQVDGFEHPPAKPFSEAEIDQELEAFVRATGAEIRHGAAMAVYRSDRDVIELPARGDFVGTPTSTPTEAYYAVLLHELTHWTGAPKRLNRIFGRRFGDRAYAFEELVAELGAAFLCARFGVTNSPRYDHAAYLASWLEILGRDRKAIFTAATLAQRAVEYLDRHNLRTTQMIDP